VDGKVRPLLGAVHASILAPPRATPATPAGGLAEPEFEGPPRPDYAGAGEAALRGKMRATMISARPP